MVLSYKRVHVPMSSGIFNEIADKIAREYSNACVLWIEQVLNPDLQMRFDEAMATMIGEEKKFEIKQLFHGTAVEAIDAICEQGFRCDCNRASAYGKGTYFATNVSTSWSYMKTSENINGAQISYMFYADVILTHDIKDMNKSGDGGILVVNKDAYLYPRYVIAFQKNAQRSYR